MRVFSCYSKSISIFFTFLIIIINSCATEVIRREYTEYTEYTSRDLSPDPISKWNGLYHNVEKSPLIDLINVAKSEIDIEIYQMKDVQVRSAIRAALKRKVKVLIVQEPSPVGDSCHIFNEPAPKDSEECLDLKALVNEVNATKNGGFRPFDKINLCDEENPKCFQHGKMVIIDKQWALLSTGNFNDSNLCHADKSLQICNRDYSFVTSEKKVVEALSLIFTNDFQGKKTDIRKILQSNKLLDKLTISPISLDEVVNFIQSAKKSIQLQNQYLQIPQLNKALMDAASRGIKVEVMVSSACFFGKPSLSKENLFKSIFKDFEKSGITSKFFTKKIKVGGKDGYLHAKAIIVDEKKAWIGSMNGSMVSANANREFGIFFDNPVWVKNLHKIISNDFKNPKALTWPDGTECFTNPLL